MHKPVEERLIMRSHSAFLIELLHGRELNRVAEIGVFKGENAFALLENLPINLYIGVDPYARYPEFDDNLSVKNGVMANANLDMEYKIIRRKSLLFGGQFQILRSYSTEAAKYFDEETFDFVFIDGNHYYDYVLADIKCWLPKVKQGGIIAGHDYVKKINCGVIRAVKELLPNHKYNKKAKTWWYEIPVEIKRRQNSQEEIQENLFRFGL